MNEVGVMGGQQSSEQALGERLQSARKAAGLTQQQLCQKSGLSYSTLAKIERGAIKAPSVFTIQSIAGVLGMTLGELMGESIGSSDSSTVKYRSKSGIRFVYFDINGCLVRFFHRAFTRLAEDSGVSADLIETAFWHYNDAVCRGDMSLEAFNTAVATDIGIANLDWKSYYLEAIDPILEMHELVTWAAKYYKVGLLSNIMPGFIDEMISHGLLPDEPYTAVIDSSQVGYIKPEANIYEIAQALTGCEPEEVLFVDDSRTNLVAGQRFGWRVLWFDDYHPEESATRVRSSLELDIPDVA
ncbi:MAG: HAD-IA family hydrolase [Candidatus Saccharimonadales bacterium]